jgi:hypothetical protein
MRKMLQPKILGIISAFVFGMFFLSVSNLSATADEGVPDWFKEVAGFWSTDKITTVEFLDGIEFLIEQEIINVEGYGLLSGAEGKIINQESVDELWASINSLQVQIDNVKEISNQPETYVKVKTDKGTAIAECDGSSVVVGGGGFPSSGKTLQSSFAVGRGTSEIPDDFITPTGWSASTTDENRDVTAIVVCMKIES